MIAADYKNILHVYDIVSRKKIKEFQASAMPLDICTTFDNKYAIASLKNGDLEVYDLLELKLHMKLLAHRSVVACIALTIDGKYIASSSETETIIWNAENFE